MFIKVAGVCVLLALSAACGGAAEAVDADAGSVPCGYGVVLADGGEEIRFTSTDAWTFLVPVDGGPLVLQGDPGALDLSQAEVVGACLRTLGQGTTTL